MNENLGINMDSYLEWNILLAVLALFGNFPYGPPLSPNGISDSFVSLSVGSTHWEHKVVYTAGNFLCSGCIGECVCGNWGLREKKEPDSWWHTKATTKSLGHKNTPKKTKKQKQQQQKFLVVSWMDMVKMTHTLLHSGNMRIFMPYMS